MVKRIAVGPKKRSGIKLRVDGKLQVFRLGELLPTGTVLPNRFFRDKRVVWVEDESVKKTSLKPVLKPVPEKTVTPSPSSGAAGSSDPAPLEVTLEAADAKPVEKKKRKRKKLFSSD